MTSDGGHFVVALGENQDVGAAVHLVQHLQELSGKCDLRALEETEEREVLLQFRFGTEQTDEAVGSVAETEERRDVDEVQHGLRNGGGKEHMLEEAVVGLENAVEVVQTTAGVVVMVGFVVAAIQTLIHFINHQRLEGWPAVWIFLLVFHLVQDAPQLCRRRHDHIAWIYNENKK